MWGWLGHALLAQPLSTVTLGRMGTIPHGHAISNKGNLGKVSNVFYTKQGPWSFSPSQEP